MSEVEIEYNRKYKEKLDKVKEISKKNWKPFTIGVVLTGVTFIVTKRVSTRHINTTAHAHSQNDNQRLCVLYPDLCAKARTAKLCYPVYRNWRNFHISGGSL
jgi:hypothetical protein